MSEALHDRDRQILYRECHALRLRDLDLHSLASLAIFLGCGRSGSGVVGTFLDAHQNVIIVHESDLLGCVDKRYTTQRLFREMIELS